MLRPVVASTKAAAVGGVEEEERREKTKAEREREWDSGGRGGWGRRLW